MVWTKAVAVCSDEYISKIEPTEFPDGEGINCIEAQREIERRENLKGKTSEFSL